jgi:DNA processing protein
MYTREEKIMIWLCSFEGLTLLKKEQLFKAYGDITRLWDSFASDGEAISRIIGGENYNKLSCAHSTEYIDKLISALEKIEIVAVTIFSKHYPELLAAINGRPLCIFCSGSLHLLKTKCIAVVGSREPTHYGRKVTKAFTEGLVRDGGFTIVSGLARGIDSTAHKTALESAGRTIAVLGGGIKNIYPSENRALAEEIIKKGLLVSEYSAFSPPQKYNFPVRNRIISGLSVGTLFTEGGASSGALNTTAYAVEQGRDVFVVPGNVDSFKSKGTNNLIKSIPHTFVTDYSDILNKYGVNSSPHTKSVELNFEETAVMGLLKNGETHFDEILENLKTETSNLNYLLTAMELKGLIEKISGNYYIEA